MPSREEIEQAFDSVARTRAERAARVIVTGVRRGRRRVLIGSGRARPVAWLQRLLPVAYQHLVAFGAARRRAEI